MSNLFIFLFGGLVTFALIGLLEVITATRAAAKVQAMERKAINDFCRDADYCYYGCGKGIEGRYYGGYNCPSDHK